MSAPDYREKLKQARERKGWSIHEAAWQAEATSIVSRNAYYDAELCEGDLMESCSLNQVIRLCGLLGIKPCDLFCEGSEKPLTLEEVARAVRQYCLKHELPLLEFENQVGWRLETVLENPKSALAEWNIDCLKDVCDMVGVDWKRVLMGL